MLINDSVLSFDLVEVLETFLASFKTESVLPYLLALITAGACGAAIGVERTLRQKDFLTEDIRKYFQENGKNIAAVMQRMLECR